MKPRRVLTTLLFLALTLILAQTAAYGQIANASPDLNNIVTSGGSTTTVTEGTMASSSSSSSSSSFTTVTVIVQFNAAPSTADLNQLASYGTVEQVFSGIYAVKVLCFTSQVASIAAMPDVTYITPDRTLHGKLDLTAAAVNAAAAASYKLDGTGVGIAIIDSGIASKVDLENSAGATRIVYSQDFTGLGSTTDGYGHGTHVAGIAAGNGSASKKSGSTRDFVGIAPNANLINLRVLDSNGQGNDSSLIMAIDRAIALKSTYNIRVINLSLGRPVFESYLRDPLCQEVEAAWRAGIVVVAAAGNQGRNTNGGIGGYGTIEAPGNDPAVITVGAMNTVGTPTRTDDKMTSYSSKGPTLYDHLVKPDLVAPGNLVASLLASTTATLFTEYSTTQLANSYYIPKATGISSDYYLLSGTSMATPVVSGAAALLIQQNSSITPDQVKARLMKTAYKSFPPVTTATDPSTGIVYIDVNDIFTVGAGYLDIQAALGDGSLASLPAKSPAVKFNSSTSTVSLVAAANVVWGSNTVWGTNVVWGSSVLSGSNVVWSSNVVWGSSALTGFNVVWGTGTNGTIDPANVVWGSNVVWGDSISGDK